MRKEKKPRRGQRDLSLPYVEHRFEAGEPDHGIRLDQFLAARISWRSRAGIRSFIEEGWVEVCSGKDPQQAPIGAIRHGLKLRTGQEVILRTPAPQAAAEEVEDSGQQSASLECLFEDDWVVAVNKPPQVSVHPSHGHLTGSLIHWIHLRHRRLFPESAHVPTLCHRLDRETSGVMLCAKDPLSRTRIGRQFEARKIQKAYLACVAGEMKEDEGEIDLPLGKSLLSKVRLKMSVRHDSDGQPSCTRWRVRKRHLGETLVELFPQTGRQHQLRVHLAAIGHPILGDKLYFGGEDVFLRHLQGELTEEDRQMLRFDRQALHAWRLELEHPMTGRPQILEAPLAADMAAIKTPELK